MPFDAMVLNAIVTETRKALLNSRAKVSRIFQLNETDVILYFRGETQLENLFFSINSSRARMHLTSRHFSHPASPPSFCMLLRKHLVGGLLVSLRQPELERVVYLDFEVSDEQGSNVKKTLVAEIMGRNSNLILLNNPDPEGKQAILGVLKPISSSLNRFRTLLPRQVYIPPPLQDKLHPLALDYQHFSELTSQSENTPTRDFLLQNLRGLSPFVADEIAKRARTPKIVPGSAKKIWEELQKILQTYLKGSWEPTLICGKDENPQDFSAIKPLGNSTTHYYSRESMSKVLDEYYDFKEKVEGRKKIREFLQQQVKQKLEKNLKKEKKQLEELEKARKAEHYRLCGELININIGKIQPRTKNVSLENIFNEEKEELLIPLDPSLSASQNAQRYFRQYRKANQGIKKIKQQLGRTRQEAHYLESILFALEYADFDTLEEIKEELQEGGYLPRHDKAPSSSKVHSKATPIKCVSSTGAEIFIGRNNRQNDYLTLRFATKNDYWFHVKDLPGAHVIVRSGPPSPATIEEAALLAAHFSRGTDSSNVAVDYAPIKNVRRHPIGKPGMVTYKNHRTVFVTPEKRKLSHLLKNTEKS